MKTLPASLKIIFVEDVVADMELALAELSREGLVCNALRVETEEELRNQLFLFKPDLVITDYQLPVFSGMRAIQIIVGLFPDLPVIVLTGSINEETAVECMKSGAWDYILKDKLRRLPYAVVEAVNKRDATRVASEAYDALRKSEKRFTEISEVSGEFIWEVDPNGLYTYANIMCETLLGYKPEELVGNKHYYELFAGENRERIRKAAEEVFSKKGTFKDFDNLVAHKSGEILRIETTGMPILDEQGELLGYRGVDKDVTRRWKLEEELRQSNEYLEKQVDFRTREIVQLSRLNQQVVDNLGLAMVTTTPNGQILSLNSEAARLLGLHEPEVIQDRIIEIRYAGESERFNGQVVVQIFEGDDHKEFTNLPGFFSENRWSYSGEAVFILPDLQPLYVFLSVNPIHDESGIVSAYVSVAIDLTERRKMEESLREREALFSAMFREHEALMFLINPENGFIEDANLSAKKFYGYDFDGEEKVHISQINTMPAHSLQLEINKALRRQLNNFIFEHKLANGLLKTVEVHSTPIEVQGRQLLFSVIHDITEKIKFEEKLLASEAENRAIINTVPDMLFKISREGIYTEYYTGWNASLYTPRENFIGKRISDILPADLAEQSMEMLEKAFLGKKVISYEYELPVDGEIHYFENRLIALNEGEVLSIIRNTTENKQSERSLRWNESLLRMMTSSSPLAFLVIDNRTDEILYFNHRFCEIWGIIPLEEKMLRKELKNNDIIPDCLPVLKDVSAFAESCKPLQDEKNRIVIEDLIPFVDGRTIRRFSSQIRSETDEYYGRFYIFEDITNRIQIEEALRQSEERWQFALEGSGDGVWDWSISDNKVFFSQQWKAMLGYEENEIRNELSEWESRVHPDDLSHCFEAINAHLNRETQVYINEHRVFCKDGTYKWILDRGKVIEWSTDGTPVRMIGTHTDITQSKLLQQKLVETIDRERELNDLKTRFVATASHEFRTPLASILIMTDTLIEYWNRLAESQVKERLDKIKEQTLHLSTIVNNVLQLSNIQQGKLSFNPQPGELVSIIHASIETFNSDPLALGRIRLSGINQKIPLMLDSGLMIQVMNNLLSNALKYSPWNSTVEVNIEVHPDVVEIAVQDHGIGIPLDEQKHMFAPFYRASNTRTIQGNGLGLNIVRESIRLHNGHISFTSAPGEGTRFLIELPFDPLLQLPTVAAN